MRIHHDNIKKVLPFTLPFVPFGAGGYAFVSGGHFLNMEEIWKDVSNFEGIYWVSNTGFVKSKRKILAPGLNQQGYQSVGLSNKKVKITQRVHKLVATAFIDNPLNKPEVNHKDGNKLNNRADNLEWATRSENMIHAAENGLLDQKGNKNNWAKHCKKLGHNPRFKDKVFLYIVQWKTENGAWVDCCLSDNHPTTKRGNNTLGLGEPTVFNDYYDAYNSARRTKRLMKSGIVQPGWTKTYKITLIKK